MLDLDTVKTDLGVTGAEDDPLIGRLIARVEAMFSARVGYPLEYAERQYAVQLPHARSALTVPAGALATVTALEIDGDTIADPAGEGFTWTEWGVIHAPDDWMFCGRVVVDYAAGYHYADDAGAGITRNVPSDIEAAGSLAVAILYNANGRDPSIRAEAVPGVHNVQFAAPGDPWAEVWDMIAHYRIVRIG